MMKKIFFLSTLFILSINCFGQIGKVSSLDPTEYIKTLRVADWKKTKVDLHNRPTIFIIHKM